MSRYAIRLTPKQCMDLYEDDLAKTEKLVNQLQAENERLKAALIQHRADLHCGSGRPCGTCKQSAEALGIDVPDRCAQAHIDKQALKRESK